MAPADAYIEENARGILIPGAPHASRILVANDNVVNQPDAAGRCLAAGMDGYLSTPIDQRALYDAVDG